MCNDVSGIAVKRWKVRPHGLFAIGYREGSSPILRKTNVKVMLMSDYEMLMVVIAIIGLVIAARKGKVSKGVFPAVQGISKILFLMSLYLKSSHFRVHARFRS